MKQVQKKLLIIYYHTKFGGVIWSGSWVISELTPADLCKPIHNIINYSTSICSFESGKCGKEEEKLQKFEYLENEKSFLDEIKTFFTVFEGLSLGEKTKNWQKIADTSFNQKVVMVVKILIYTWLQVKIVKFWYETVTK